MSNEQFLYDRPTFPAQLDMSHPSTRGLVACWMMNETGGLSVMDSSPSKNNLLMTAFVPPIYRASHSGLLFAGAQYLTKSVSNFRSGDSQGSIEICFCTSATTANTVLFGSSDTAATNNYWDIGISTGVIYLACRNGAGDAADSVLGSATFNDGKWHHLVFSSDGSTWLAFVDGVSDALSVTAGANTGDWLGDIALRDNVTIGALKRTSTSNYFTGVQGFTRVYSCPMLQPEARSLYLNPYDMFQK